MNFSTCLYGDHPIAKNSDEHVFSKRLGCPNSMTIRGVCKKCNETILSALDTELLDSSPLALINSYAGVESSPRNIWSVDESADYLLVEGYYDHTKQGIKPFPQLVFRNDQFEIRGDGDEILAIGQDKLRDLLLNCATNCLNPQTPFINFQIDPKFLHEPFKFPPRVFARSIADLQAGRRLYARFKDRENEAFMKALVEGREQGFKNLSIKLGSTTGKFYLEYSPELLQRAIFKVTLNVLKFSCEKTEISYKTYSNTSNIVMGVPADPRLAVKHYAGFMRLGENNFLESATDEHVVSIGHSHGYWHFWMSFFGRTIGIGAVIPGSSNENWRTKKYLISTDRATCIPEEFIGFLPPSGKLSWNLDDLLPSMDINKFEIKKLDKLPPKALRSKAV